MNNWMAWGSLLLIGVAFVCDVRTMRIPNWLTLSFAPAGVALHSGINGIGGLQYSAAGIAAGFLPLALVVYVRRDRSGRCEAVRSGRGLDGMRSGGGADDVLLSLRGSWSGCLLCLEILCQGACGKGFLRSASAACQRPAMMICGESGCGFYCCRLEPQLSGAGLARERQLSSPLWRRFCPGALTLLLMG